MVQFLGPETDIMGERIFMKFQKLNFFHLLNSGSSGRISG